MNVRVTRLTRPWFLMSIGLVILVTLGTFDVVNVRTAYAATITVDRTDDTAAAFACTGAANDCSLRGAIIFANANAATTINIPAGLYQLTIDGASEAGLCTDPTIGDLDVTASNTTIIGAGPGTNPATATIIQQTTPHDRAICVNPTLVPDFNFTMSGVTVAGGRETFDVGGGGVSAGGLRNNTTITNCLFVNNQTDHSSATHGNLGGGGLQIGGGNATVTNCTFGAANPPGGSQTDLTTSNSSSVNGGVMS